MKTGCCGGCDKHEGGVEHEAKSPPGWGKTVEKMKEDHPEIDNPFALAWHMKNKGYTPHYAARSVLTPGVSTLLRLLRSKGPMKRKHILRTPDFHGWDPGSFEALVTSLNEMNLLSQSGEVLGLRTASIQSRVAIRYLMGGR